VVSIFVRSQKLAITFVKGMSIMNTPRIVHFILFLAVLISTTIASAQSPLKIGVEGGVNFGNASTSPTSVSFSSRTGLMAGALLEVYVSDVFYFQPEVLYAQKGAEFSVSSSSGSGTLTWKFDYIEIPLLLEAKFGQSEFKPMIYGGPNIGFNVSATAEGSNGSSSGSVDIKDQVESIDFALDFGAGGEYAINPTTALIASIRYSLGISDIDKDATSTWNTRGVQLLVGAKFTL
jgi:hypothetical protein